MGILSLCFAGAMRWFASMQYQPVPRRMMMTVCYLSVAYACYLFYYEPDRAWEIRWVGRAILRGALAIVDALIP